MSSPFCYPLYSYYLAGSFAVRGGDHLLFWDHLRTNLGIICGRGSFAVSGHLLYTTPQIFAYVLFQSGWHLSPEQTNTCVDTHFEMSHFLKTSVSPNKNKLYFDHKYWIALHCIVNGYLTSVDSVHKNCFLHVYFPKSGNIIIAIIPSKILNSFTLISSDFLKCNKNALVFEFVIPNTHKHASIFLLKSYIS